jgi:hypothetical protein
MNQPKYKKDDLVFCKDSEELEQPMRIAGLHSWCQYVVLDNGRNLWQYDVVGKHKRNGKDVTVCLSESQLNENVDST